MLFLHGLGGNPDDFEFYKKELQSTLGVEEGNILSPHIELSSQIFAADLEELALSTFEENKSFFDKNSRLVICGQSQGGILAVFLVNKLIKMGYTNIHAHILSAPFFGSEVVEKGLNVVNSLLPNQNKFDVKSAGLIINLFGGAVLPGLAKISTGNSANEELQRKLRECFTTISNSKAGVTLYWTSKDQIVSQESAHAQGLLPYESDNITCRTIWGASHFDIKKNEEVFESIKATLQ